ncbi:hypothetical protein [Dankookia sp. P2]|uniref:hypothetical protein n=1 Tax=Dankookia sp. P2 TaxID=3423955 RepID=UPI003D668FF2
MKSQRQAVAIALHEAGASRDETPAKNRRNLRVTKARERKSEETRASLYAEATQRGDRRTVTHDQGGAGTGAAAALKRGRNLPGQPRAIQGILDAAMVTN